MNWYLAKIVYRIICGNGDHTPQFDEQLRLIYATDKENAFHKAYATGKQEEESFINIKQQPVKWQFINVAELYKVGEMLDGAEMYSKIEEREDGDNYTEIINKKAFGILHSDSHELLQLA